MRAKSTSASFGVVAVVIAATSLGVRADEDLVRGRTNEVIKSQPATPQNAALRHYRPKPGCFATGTRDRSGALQVVC